MKYSDHFKWRSIPSPLYKVMPVGRTSASVTVNVLISLCMTWNSVASLKWTVKVQSYTFPHRKKMNFYYIIKWISFFTIFFTSKYCNDVGKFIISHAVNTMCTMCKTLKRFLDLKNFGKKIWILRKVITFFNICILFWKFFPVLEIYFLFHSFRHQVCAI